jgi:hypothetical protein
MPLGDVSYQNDAVDAVIGSWPASGAVYAYWYSDPQAEDDPADVEIVLTSTGLSNGAFASSDWSSAADGASTATISLGTATADIDDTFNYWGIKDGSGLIVYSDAIDDPFGVNNGDVVSLDAIITFATDAL